MKPKYFLWVDGVINLGLGFLLLLFPQSLVVLIGVPKSPNPFYPSILGAVLIGIGLALFWESTPKRLRVGGLGLGGAVLINFCGSISLAYWLLFGNLELSLNGRRFLWGIGLLVLGLGMIELISEIRSRAG